MSSDLSSRALAAAVSVAERHGLPITGVRVLRDKWNLIVRLEPHPVAIRVATLTGIERANRIEGLLHQEAALLEHLARHEAASVRPSPWLSPGPHREDGFWMVAMAYVEHTPDVFAAPEALGRTLRQLHAALATFDAPMPTMDHLNEAHGMLAGLSLPDATRRMLERGATRLEPVMARLMRRPHQALHGDSHRGNTLLAPTGPVWTDFEEACRGPVGWDLACLVTRAWQEGAPELALMLDAYDPAPDVLEDLAAWVEMRTFVVTLWDLSLAIKRGASPEPALQRWLKHFARPEEVET